MANDADFAEVSEAGPELFKVALGSVSDPNASTGHTAVVRFTDAIGYSWDFTLYQGITVIAAWSDATAVGGVFQNSSYTLSAGEANAITNYGALHIQAQVNGSLLGAICEVSQIYLQVPDAGPTISSQPADAQRNAGSTAGFSVTASGAGTVTYQWSRAERDSDTFTSIGGATSSSYTTSTLTVSGDHGSRFRVVCTDSNGSTTSSIALLEVGLANTFTINDSVPVELGLTFSSAAAAKTFTINDSGPASLAMTFTSVPAESDDSFMLLDHFPAGAGGTNVSVNATGVSATGAVGNEAVTADANRTQTGVSGTGSVGNEAVTANADRTQTGVSGTGAVGDEAVTGNANSNEDGVGGTGSVGTVVTSGNANETCTGVGGTGSTGTCVTHGDANSNVTGVEATGSVGTVTISLATTTNVNVAGVEATASVGDETVTADANRNATGVAATGSVGTVNTTAASNVVVTGVTATGAVGTVLVIAESPNATVTVTGVGAVGSVGRASVWVQGRSQRWTRFQPIRDRVVTVRGVEAQATAGRAGIHAQKVEPDRQFRVHAITRVQQPQTVKSALGKVSISISARPITGGIVAYANAGRVSFSGWVDVKVRVTIGGRGDAGEAHAVASAGPAPRGAFAHGYVHNVERIKAIRNPTDEELMAVIIAATRRPRRR